MERVAFIVDRTQERIACLLNPESFELKRRAGVEVRQVEGGLVTGTELTDDPLHYTGGGTTELTLNLLFDVSLTDPALSIEDVRELTGPLWQLAENNQRADSYAHPSIARFVWGKAWNIPGIIVSIAERLEHFSIEGVPRRAWLRLRMLRVADDAADLVGGAIAPPRALVEEDLATSDTSLKYQLGAAYASQPGGAANSTERLDELAFRFYGNAALWRLLAWGNQIADPTALDAGTTLDVPRDRGESSA